MTAPTDFDASRAAVAARGLVAPASAALTEVAALLPFEDLGPFKTLLKRLFSTEPWTGDDAVALSDLVLPYLFPSSSPPLGGSTPAADFAEAGGRGAPAAAHNPAPWWETPLDDEIVLSHGVTDGGYVVWVTGAGAGPAPAGLFDRVFSGPVKPEATPHPRKVKFNLGGPRAPGRWYTRTDEEPPDDARATTLLADPDVTDVMVAGDFVTIGLGRTASWEDRLDDMLETVAGLFPVAGAGEPAARTRDELLEEGRATRVEAPRELHLLDPDDPDGRDHLSEALESPDARLRRIAVAVLAESEDAAVAHGALRRGYADTSRVVRRTAVDSAADAEDESLRDLFELALADEDPWTRWKAVRSLGELGIAPSRDAVDPLTHDPDFQVRFEVARVLRGE